MSDEVKVYYDSKHVAILGDKTYYQPADMKNQRVVWDWIEENNISIIDNGIDFDGSFLVFLHARDAIRFKLWLE